MKAIVCTKFGFQGLKLEEVPKPTPGDNEVLVEVRASSVNTSNLAMVSGKPFLGRLFGAGFLKPKTNRPGTDIAGKVEAVGKNVTQFKSGDEVYGDLCQCGYGAYSEFVSVPENVLAFKPANISFEEAAAVPEAALVALLALRDAGHIKIGQKVLIYGASGGIGTFAIQIAKSFGTEVTGVSSTRNLDLVLSIGADRVIDYTKEDFAQNFQKYDLILATTGYRSIFDYKRALSPKGIYVATGGSTKVGPMPMAQIFEAMLLGPWISKNGGKKLCFKHLDTISQKDLSYLKMLIEAGKVKPVIDKHFPLSEVAEALRYYSEGHTRGKVSIIMKHNNKT
jgi:NADPH:quinone reductase-like Zn-dependent oxidoreductase